MQITMLFLKRKGADMPEAIGCIDEYEKSDNPDWWPRYVRDQKAAIGSEAEAWTEVIIDVADADVIAAFQPREIPSEIVTTDRGK